MKYRFFYTSIVGIVMLNLIQADTCDVSIIPKPQYVGAYKGHFTIQDHQQIWMQQDSQDLIKLASVLQGIINSHSSEIAHYESIEAIDSGYILDVDPSYPIPKEGYELVVEANRVMIKAADYAGAFYCLQSLKQLIVEENGVRVIPKLVIHDAPRFSHRGLHLDVSRHMFSLDFLKKYIDLMALHKLNTFHWHLTDDQGWRIEIKKYPKLQEISAFRKQTAHYTKVWDEFEYDGIAYGGYYTQEQIKELVAYAQDRAITIIPEIDVPGHSLATLAAYPHLGCTKGPYEVGTHWMISEDIFCAGQEASFAFLEDVFSEVIDLFPGQYIHIGGDEVPKKAWKECEKCQARMQEYGLKDEEELQSYFIKRLEKFLNAKGKSIIGWDEILQGGLSPTATVMSWTRTGKSAVACAKLGNKVIVCPQKPMYLDHYQSKQPSQPMAIGGYNPLKKVYEYEPIPQELTEEESLWIQGVQANVWTEFMETEEHVEFMAYPRAIALAEVAWSCKEGKSFDDFLARLKKHFHLLDKLNVHYNNKNLEECIEVAPPSS